MTGVARSVRLFGVAGLVAMLTGCASASPDVPTYPAPGMVATAYRPPPAPRPTSESH
jgi:hypothetical protein